MHRVTIGNIMKYIAVGLSGILYCFQIFIHLCFLGGYKKGPSVEENIPAHVTFENILCL